MRGQINTDNIHFRRRISLKPLCLPITSTVAEKPEFRRAGNTVAAAGRIGAVLDKSPIGPLIWTFETTGPEFGVSGYRSSRPAYLLDTVGDSKAKSMQFAVLTGNREFEFPVRSNKFPVRFRAAGRRLGAKYLNRLGYSRHGPGHGSLFRAIFPVFSLINREFDPNTGGEGFAADCVLQRRVICERDHLSVCGDEVSGRQTDSRSVTTQ